MKILACTKISCPNEPRKRHAVTLFEDGSVTCDCADGVERGRAYAGRLLLGMPPIDGARGCAVLVAMVEAAETLVTLANSSFVPEYGAWSEAMTAYRQSPVVIAALARATHAERVELKQLVLREVERVGYKHKLGKRRFRSEFRAVWDMPAPAMDGLLVAMFDDDPWRVPYMPGWKEHVFDQGLSIVDGHFVCGRSVEDPRVLYAITRSAALNTHKIARHMLLGRGKNRRLCEILE